MAVTTDASGYGAAATSLASSVGSILESMSLPQAAYDTAYNQSIEAFTNKQRVAQQNLNNSKVAGMNLQQLAIAQASIGNNAALNSVKSEKEGLFKSQAGNSGVLSVQRNQGGTLNLLQAGLALQQNKAERQGELLKLAQGYQLPLVGNRYRTPSMIPGIINSMTGLIKSGQAAYNLYEKNQTKTQTQDRDPDQVTMENLYGN